MEQIMNWKATKKGFIKDFKQVKSEIELEILLKAISLTIVKEMIIKGSIGDSRE